MVALRSQVSDLWLLPYLNREWPTRAFDCNQDLSSRRDAQGARKKGLQCHRPLRSPCCGEKPNLLGLSRIHVALWNEAHLNLCRAAPVARSLRWMSRCAKPAGRGGGRRKSLKAKGLCLAPRRGDARFERPLRPSRLCVLASLREPLPRAARDGFTVLWRLEFAGFGH